MKKNMSLKNIETIKNLLDISKVNYPNNITKYFNESYNLIEQENQFNILNILNKCKSSLCLGCFNYYFNNNQNLIKIPCGCVFCSIKCLQAFFDKLPFYQMNFFHCVCGVNYELIELKYLLFFLNSLNFHKIQNFIIKFIYNKIKNKCALCNKEINLKKEEICKINVIEIKDLEIEKIFNIRKYNHLICNECWNKINEKTRIICNICNSLHFVEKKFQINNT